MIVAMIKSAIVLSLAACIATLMKRQSAAVRHIVWTAGLIGALAVPLCSLALPSWHSGAAEQLLHTLQDSVPSLETFRHGAIGLWIAGAAAGMMLLLFGAGRLAWIALHSEPVEDSRWAALAEEVRMSLGIRRPVRFLQNRSVPFLGTWGIVAPRVLLPPDAESWPDDRIRMVLAHELAHIKRLDWVIQVLADAARAIYWFNPVFWLASSRLRRESEYACDDTVVRLGAAGTHYAEELLAMTRALRTEHGVDHPILTMAQPSHLEQRLMALLNPSLNRLAATPWAVIVVAGVAVALTLPLAAVRSPENPPAPPTIQPSLAPTPTAASDSRDSRESSTPAPVKVLSVASATSQPPAPVTPEIKLEIKEESLVETPAEKPAEPPPYQCNISTSVQMTKTVTLAKQALGNGPWFINDDRTIWASDEPFVANRAVNTVWMRPANTELTITGKRLDGDAPELHAGPAAPFNTGYIGVSLTFPSAGCWEVTATAGDSRLTFTTQVRE